MRWGVIVRFYVIYGTKYSWIDQAKFVDDSLWSGMVYLKMPSRFKFFKGCLPQILLDPLLNTLPHLLLLFRIHVLLLLLLLLLFLTILMSPTKQKEKRSHYLLCGNSLLNYGNISMFNRAFMLKTSFKTVSSINASVHWDKSSVSQECILATSLHKGHNIYRCML